MRRAHLCVLGVGGMAAACRDAPTSPAAHGYVALQPVFERQVDLAAFNLAIDSLRIVVVRPPEQVVADTTVFFPPDASEIRIAIPISMIALVETFDVTLELSGQGVELFTGTRPVTVEAGTPDPSQPPEEIVVGFTGPGANVATLVVEPADSVLSFGESGPFRVSAFDLQGTAVPQFYVSWNVVGSTAAAVNALGVVTAPAARGQAYVRAATPNGVADSTLVTFIPAPAALRAVGGSLTGAVGSQVDLVVEVLAADQQGVKGIPVQFVSVSGGGSVAPTEVISDATGLAQATATLSTGAGTQLFEARVAGLTPLQLPVTATALGATTLVLASGNGQTDSVVALLPQPLVVAAQDQFGNGVAGVAVSFQVTAGGGSVSAAQVTTDAQGRAQVTWRLGTVAGAPQTLQASATGLAGSPLTFSATATAAAPAVLIHLTGLTGVTAGEVIVPPLQVGIEDQFGNSVGTATNSVTVALGANPGGALLGGATTQAAVGGVATFDDLSVSTAGVGYTLVAMSTGLTPDTSSAFTAIAPSGMIAWANSVSGVWSDPGNWDPGRVPASTDTVFITVAGTYTVTLDVSPTIQGLSLGGPSGAQTLAVPGAQTLTLGAGAAINPTGVLHLSGSNLTIDGGNALDLNGGTIQVDTGRVLIIGSGDPTRLTYRGGTLVGGGALSLSAGATLDLGATLSLDAIVLFLNDATVNRLTTERLIVGPNGLVVTQATNGVNVNAIVENDGVVIVRGVSTFVNDSLINLPGSALQVEGTSGNTALAVANGLLNHGDVVLTSSVTGAGATLQVTSGALLNDIDGMVVSASGSGGARTLAAELDNRGSLSLLHPLSLDRTSAAHVNTGQIQLLTGSLTVAQTSDSPSFTNRDSIIVGTGQTLLVTGGTFVNDISPTEGVIAGDGLVDVSATTFSNLGSISPGLSPGVLTWQGDVPFGPGAGLAIELGGTTVGALYDQLAVSDIVTFGGTLNVTLIPGFTPALGDQFTILTYGSQSGQFAGVNLPALPAGLAWQPSINPTSLVLEVVGEALPGVQWISPVSGSWSDPTKWSTGVVPGPGDSVLIEVPGIYTVTLDVSDTVGWLHVGAASGAQTLAQAANTLTVSNAATVAANGVYELAGGVFDGPGSLTIGGAWNWSGGAMAGTGTTTLSTGATVTFSGGLKTLDSRTLENSTTIVWTAGDWFFEGPAAATNLSGATVDMQGDLRMALNTGGTFRNLGTFVKSAGSGTGELSLPFTNDGTVDVLSGSLGLTALGGTLTHGGAFNGATGTTLMLSNANPNTQTFDGPVSGFSHVMLPNSSGTFTFNAAVTVSHIGIGGVGAVFNGSLSALDSVGIGGTGASMELNTGATVAMPYLALDVNSFGVTGTDGVTVSDSLFWNYGGFQTAGTVTLEATAIARIVTTGVPKSAAGLFVNNGTVLLSGGPMNFAGGITNAAGATFDIEADATVGGAFTNQGTLTKSGGVGTATMSGPLQNDAVLDVSSGTLALTSDLTHSVGAVARGSGTLDLSGATILAFNGDVHPGTSPGILTISGPFVPGAPSTLNIEIGGTTVGAGYDQLVVSGAATLGGTLDVQLISGFTPKAGDQFTVLRYGAPSGDFATVNLPALPPGLTWQRTFNATDMVLEVLGPPPQILFAGDSAGDPANSGIFKVDGDGANQFQITTEGPPAELNVQPRWSPDRTRITYSARQPGEPNQLHIRSADEATVFHVTSVSDTSTFFPRYSPNGVHLAFQCGDGGYPNTPQDVCVIADVTNPLDGMGDGNTGKAFVTDSVDVRLGGSGAFAWNPQKPDQLAVARDSVLGGPVGSLIWLVNYDGSGAMPLGSSVIRDDAGDPVRVAAMDWSPDGSFIVFEGISGTTRSIFRIEVATGNVTQLTTLNQDFRPVVSPDNTEILFGRENDIWTLMKIPAGGGAVVQMSQNMNFGLDQAGWDWSPDGSEIVVTEDVTTTRTGVVISKILPTTTATSFFTDAKQVGRRGGVEIQDRQASWRP